MTRIIVKTDFSEWFTEAEDKTEQEMVDLMEKSWPLNLSVRYSKSNGESICPTLKRT